MVTGVCLAAGELRQVRAGQQRLALVLLDVLGREAGGS
jgi:hypothetical protein